MSTTDDTAASKPTLNFSVDSPLDFRLWDEEQNSNIYIEGGEKLHTHTLDLWNKDPENRSVVFHKTRKALPDNNSNALDDFFHSNHHLELRFRVGTISQSSLDAMTLNLKDQLIQAANSKSTPDFWYAHHRKTPNANEISIYLLSSKQKTLTTSANNFLKIVLPHLTIDPRSGANVVPIEMRPGPLTKRSDGALIVGLRMTHLQVLSQLGIEHFPLNFSIEGSNTVINDGSSTTNLVLRIAYVGTAAKIPFKKIAPGMTHFILACELARPKDYDWALSDDPGKVKVFLQKKSSDEFPHQEDGFWQSDEIASTVSNRHIEWVIDAKLLEMDAIWNHQSFYLRLQVQTSMRTGPTDLKLSYRNVPGYQDDDRTVIIQKSPLHFIRTDNGLDYAGLGTTKPKSKLAVAGGLTVGADFATSETAPQNGLLIEGSVGIGASDPGTSLYVKPKVKENNSAVFVGGMGVSILGITDKEQNKTKNKKNREDAYNALHIVNHETKMPTVWVGNKGTGATLHIEQKSTGRSGEFVGGSGVLIQGVKDKVNSKTQSNALNITDNETKAATLGVVNKGVGSTLYAEQKGTGQSGEFVGGSGVLIQGVKDKANGKTLSNALNITNNETKAPTLAVVNKGAGATLYAEQKGTGKAGIFQGDVEVRGNLTSKNICMHPLYSSCFLSCFVPYP